MWTLIDDWVFGREGIYFDDLHGNNCDVMSGAWWAVNLGDYISRRGMYGIALVMYCI